MGPLYENIRNTPWPQVLKGVLLVKTQGNKVTLGKKNKVRLRKVIWSLGPQGRKKTGDNLPCAVSDRKQ
jgi:hypothetical protein